MQLKIENKVVWERGQKTLEINEHARLEVDRPCQIRWRECPEDADPGPWNGPWETNQKAPLWSLPQGPLRRGSARAELLLQGQEETTSLVLITRGILAPHLASIIKSELLAAGCNLKELALLAAQRSEEGKSKRPWLEEPLRGKTIESCQELSKRLHSQVKSQQGKRGKLTRKSLQQNLRKGKLQLKDQKIIASHGKIQLTQRTASHNNSAVQALKQDTLKILELSEQPEVRQAAQSLAHKLTWQLRNQGDKKERPSWKSAQHLHNPRYRVIQQARKELEEGQWCSQGGYEHAPLPSWALYERWVQLKLETLLQQHNIRYQLSKGSKANIQKRTDTRIIFHVQPRLEEKEQDKTRWIRPDFCLQIGHHILSVDAKLSYLEKNRQHEYEQSVERYCTLLCKQGFKAKGFLAALQQGPGVLAIQPSSWRWESQILGWIASSLEEEARKAQACQDQEWAQPEKKRQP